LTAVDWSLKLFQTGPKDIRVCGWQNDKQWLLKILFRN